MSCPLDPGQLSSVKYNEAQAVPGLYTDPLSGWMQCLFRNHLVNMIQFIDIDGQNRDWKCHYYKSWICLNVDMLACCCFFRYLEVFANNHITCSQVSAHYKCIKYEFNIVNMNSKVK